MSLKVFLLCCLLLSFGLTGTAQDLLKDNHTLKLTKVATNKKYGYSEKKPIKVGGINGYVKASQFFAALRGPNGEPIKYRRLGSCCFFKTPNALIGDKGLLDRYSVYYGGLEEPLILYVNEYDYEQPLCPKGFTFKTEEEVQAITKLDPTVLQKISACEKEAPFAVEDFLLLETLNYEKEEKSPTVAPRPKAGEEALKAYFLDKKITDERASSALFMVKISCLVNCKGEVGNYSIISKGRGPLEEMANQVLEVVNEMDIKWLPAEKEGKEVDCYQVLNFTVKNGSLSQVSIR